jgi:HAD superfamily hydrolase (TIGR01450 family)
MKATTASNAASASAGPGAASSPLSSYTMLSSFRDLIPKYDGFILDQYGVLHNGQESLPGAVECIQELALKKHNKKLIVLSNTSSPSHAALARLQHLGFDPAHFVGGAVTSGDEAAKYIRQTYQGKKGLWLTWKEGKVPYPRDFLKLCGENDIETTDSVEDADYVLLHGCEVIRRDRVSANDSDNTQHEENIASWARESSLGRYLEDEDYSIIDPILQQCLKRNLPMVCANPDNVVVKADGSLANMPGKIASRYQSMGGTCRKFGKPHAAHFEACLDKLGLDKDRVIHVGDSLSHDIAGANAAGIDSVLITGGIHIKELGVDFGALPDPAVLQDLIDREGQNPTYVLPAFAL